MYDREHSERERAAGTANEEPHRGRDDATVTLLLRGLLFLLIGWIFCIHATAIRGRLLYSIVILAQISSNYKINPSTFLYGYLCSIGSLVTPKKIA